MKTRHFFSAFALLFCFSAISFSENEGDKTPTPADTPASKEAAPSNADLIAKRVETFKKVQAETIQRLGEINKKLLPFKESIAEKLGVSATEYRFLRIEARNPDVAKAYFKNFRERMKKSYVTINGYFEGANVALSKNNLWYGNEESLIDHDATLLSTLESEIVKNFDLLPNGAEMKALLDEQTQLEDKLAHPDEIALYYLSRKGWFAGNPDYMQAVEEGRSMPSTAGKR